MDSTKTFSTSWLYPVGMESQELAYFIAVAEERNVSRAAARLGIAQPALSRAIRRLERRLDVRLLDRNNRGVSPTRAGDVLLKMGRHAIAALTEAEHSARRAGQAVQRLRIVKKPGGDAALLHEILPRYAEHPDAVEIDVSVCRIGEEKVRLRTGAADIAFLRLPQDDMVGLASQELLTERELVVLPWAHRLSGRESVTMVDLADETLPRWTAESPGEGRLIQDTGQVAELIRHGSMVAVLPESVALGLGGLLTTVPLRERRTTVHAVWSKQHYNQVLAAFVRIAAETVDQHRERV